jgi:hypothetical protein
MQREGRLAEARALQRLERLDKMEVHGAGFTRAVASGKVKSKG